MSSLDKFSQKNDERLSTGETKTVKAQFDKFIKRSSTFNAIQDMQERAENACIMIMNKLQLTKSSLHIPDLDLEGPSKKYTSFRRLMSKLLAETEVTETSSEANLSTIGKIKPANENGTCNSDVEDHKTEESFESNKKVALSDESDFDPEKILNYYNSPEKVVVDLGLQASLAADDAVVPT